MKATELLKEQSNAEKTVRPLYSDEELKKLKEKENKELEQINEPINGSIVILRTNDKGEYFGTVGKYRVTNLYEELEDLKYNVNEIKKNDLYNVMVAVTDSILELIQLQEEVEHQSLNNQSKEQ